MNIDLKQFGIILKTLRKERKITVLELAGQAGVSNYTIQNYQYGRQKPSLKSIIGICKALDVSPNQLLDGCVRGSEQDYIVNIIELIKKIPNDVVLTVEDWLNIILNYLEEISNISDAGYGKRLRTLREESRLSLVDVATICHIVPDTLKQIECSQTYPGIELFLELCEIYHVSPEFLLGHDIHISHSSDTPLVARLRFLTPRQLVLLYDLAGYWL